MIIGLRLMGFIMKIRSWTNLPDSIDVKGVNYKIKIVKNLKDDDGKICLGLHDHDGKIISINATCKGAEKKKTFLHEMAHAYIYECHAREGLDSQMEEVLVEILVNAFDNEFDIRWRKKK